MDARLRNLFSKRRSQKHDQLQLRAHPYESTVKQTSPIKGTRPVAGNGPYRLENVALQSQLLVAEPPNVPRSRGDSYSTRPRTAPQSAPIEPYGRTRSSFSTKAPSTSSRHAHEPPQTNPYYPPHATRVKSVHAFSSDALPSHNQSPHVDILDAVTRINPSAQTFIQKRIASGKRDYGEDVADRNIAEFGGDEFPQHDAYSYYTDDAAHSLDEPSRDDELQGRPDRREKLDSRDGSTRGPGSRFESDGAGDDTRPPSQNTQYSASRIYSYANQNPSHSTPPTAANSHVRRESSNSDHSNAYGMRGKDRPGRASSASIDAGPSVIPAPWSNAITSANLYYVSGGVNHTVSTNEPIREATNTSQPVLKTKESRGTQTTPPPPERIITPPVIPQTSPGRQDTEDLDSDDSYDPPPILRSRLSRHTILPTPPMSPTPGGSPTTSIPRASLDKELPLPPPGVKASPTSKRQSRGGSASYSEFPLQESRQNALGTALPPTVTTGESSSVTVRPKEGKRGAPASEGTVQPPRLDDDIHTNNTTDTEVITTRRPAIVHEHLTPKVHHIKEERITREIHNHDVFHRIQPIIDVEVLPTKHYIPAPNGNGLIEIPESELPGRHTEWAVQPVDDKLVTSASVQSRADFRTTAKHPEYFSGREALVQDRQKSITDDGITREETVWYHPTQLENGGQESGQTVPLNIDPYGDEDTDDYYDTASERYAASDPYAGSEQTFSTNADGEEELLFRDSDLAFDGRLPGLEEVNPVVEGNVSASRPSTATTATHKVDSIGEGEATKALRRRQEAELAQKLGELSVAGR